MKNVYVVKRGVGEAGRTLGLNGLGLSMRCYHRLCFHFLLWSQFGIFTPLRRVVVHFTFYMAGLLCFWQFFTHSWQLSVLIFPLKWQAITLRLWGDLRFLSPAVDTCVVLGLCSSIATLIASSFWKTMPMQFLTALLGPHPLHRWGLTFA